MRITPAAVVNAAALTMIAVVLVVGAVDWFAPERLGLALLIGTPVFVAAQAILSAAHGAPDERKR